MGRKRSAKAVKMAWIGLPLVPILFLLFLDWERVRDHGNALWQRQARIRTVPTLAAPSVPPTIIETAEVLSPPPEGVEIPNSQAPAGTTEMLPPIEQGSASGVSVVNVRDSSTTGQ